MTHNALRITHNKTRQFGFNLALGMNILGCIMFYRNRGHFIWFSGIGSTALILGILCPKLLSPIKKVLDAIIFSFGWIVNKITLFVSFYLMFTPIGGVLRVFGKDLLSQKIDENCSSYWIKRKTIPFSKESYERMG